MLKFDIDLIKLQKGGEFNPTFASTVALNRYSKQ